MNIQLGNGAVATGFCCISVGDSAVSRGAFQVSITSKLTFPDSVSADALEVLIGQLKDNVLTYQAMVEQKFAPREFFTRAKAAVDIAIDECTREKDRVLEVQRTSALQTPATPVVPSNTPAVPSGGESLPNSRVEQVD